MSESFLGCTSFRDSSPINVQAVFFHKPPTNCWTLKFHLSLHWNQSCYQSPGAVITRNGPVKNNVCIYSLCRSNKNANNTLLFHIICSKSTRPMSQSDVSLQGNNEMHSGWLAGLCISICRVAVRSSVAVLGQVTVGGPPQGGRWGVEAATHWGPRRSGGVWVY